MLHFLRWVGLNWLFLASYSVASASQEASGDKKVVFTVRDSIEMQRILTMDGHYPFYPGDRYALYSPNKTYVLVRTRRGDLVGDANIDTLLLWHVEDIRQTLTSEANLSIPKPHTLVEKRFHRDWEGISQVQWITENELGFISVGDNGRLQVFSVRADTGAITQVTRSPTNVRSFAASDEKIVFFADPHEQSQTVITVGVRSLYSFLENDDPTARPIELYQMSRRTGATWKLPTLPVLLFSNRIWISPSGRYAVTLTPVTEVPAYWSRYEVFNSEQPAFSKIKPDPESIPSELRAPTRYQLIDLKLNTVRNLLDAPDGSYANNFSPREVFWPADERTVIISNTYLPVRQGTRPAIAEVDLYSGEVTPILWEPLVTFREQQAGKQLEPIVALQWDSGSSRLIVVRSIGGQRLSMVFRKEGDRWVKDSDSTAPLQGDIIHIERREGLNERPKLYATGGLCACTKMIFDPAPNADRFTFGHTELFTWKDRNLNEWRGALVYPVGYVAGQRYPLVIQTHGFRSREFLTDGPEGTTTAFAAQPLANAGFMVLQAAESPAAITGNEDEGSLVADGWRSAIRKLVDEGLVSKDKIGLIAWSRTGYHALHLLAEEPNLLVAATISDSVQYGYLQYVLSLNDNVTKADMEAVSGVVGMPPDTLWFDRNPLYKLVATQAAIRLEAIGLGSLVAMWETYSILRDAHRVVDFVYFPAGTHVLMKPSERLGSQEENVDWFRFWLQGYEDDSVDKMSRYKRWHRLRYD